MITAIALVAGGAGAFSMFMLGYTESASFCGRCHTMKPELRAYELGPHRDVKCGECHVGPGVGAFVKSKINGTKQLFEVLTNSHPEPIKAEPDKLPSTEKTCQKCHNDLKQRPDVVVVRSYFGEDEKNSEQRVGLAVRLNSVSPNGAGNIHAHNDLKIQFTTNEAGDTVDWMRVERPDGTTAEYVATNAIHISSMATSEIDALKKSETVRTFSCTDCHNRAGHELPSPDKEIDSALGDGRLDKTLPYIKHQSLAILSQDYPSREKAQEAIAGLRAYYQTDYPDVFSWNRPAIEAAIVVLDGIYDDIASPDMKASYKVYPSNLGHENGEGCFRCHDGGHVRVDDGKLSQTSLAWECSTCHSFPVWGSDVVNVAVSSAPQYHDQPLWLFEHKNVAQISNPVPQPCSNCHTQTFCTNCHNTGVRHDQMLFSHASLARDRGLQTCAFCHQQVYCQSCHSSISLPSVATDPPRPP